MSLEVKEKQIKGVCSHHKASCLALVFTSRGEGEIRIGGGKDLLPPTSFSLGADL